MNQASLLELFLQFGLAALIGFLIGLEREVSGGKSTSMGGRDFVLFALTGAATGFAAMRFGLPWIMPGAFIATVTLVVSRYWKDDEQGPGITTELAAVLTFVLGALIVHGARELAVALAIITFALLAHKREIKSFRRGIRSRDLDATLKLLVISFLILPVLPQQSLDRFLETEIGSVQQIDASAGQLVIQPVQGSTLETGKRVTIRSKSGRPDLTVRVLRQTESGILGEFEEPVDAQRVERVAAGEPVHAPLSIESVRVVLSAIKPYTLWLIVILVSLISFVGYILIKLLGSGIGVGLTGVVGGLVSSTVTTLSFARRSVELPKLNRSLSVAILLASSMMFPRLLLEMFVVNRALAMSVAPPLLLMSAVGFGLAAVQFFRSQRNVEATKPLEFDNPFSLTAAVSFAGVFAAILVLTRTATHYLGDAWLPAVALISGLTDADAIAFSLSDAHSSEWISLHWASFNLVLGAIANTLAKLALVFFLADRGLFRTLLIPFAIISAVGVATALLFYGYAPGVI